MKIQYCILFLIISLTQAFAQEANVTFITDKDCEVFVYKPIDGGYNNKIPTERFIVSHEKNAHFKTNVSSYTYILCQFPQYERQCNLLLFPNDSIQICLNKQGLSFQGSNNIGLQYYYDNFEKFPDLENYLKIQNIFIEYVENKRELNTILPTINDTLNIPSHYKWIRKLPQHTDAQKKFSEVLEKEIYMYINYGIIPFFDYVLSAKQKNNSLTVKDSIKIQVMIDSIYEQLPISYELLKYPSNSYVWKYFGHYYGNKKCPEEYDSDMCGPYTKYLFAPTEMQPSLLGHACLVQLKYNTGEMNLSKLKKFFNEKFPKSEYAAIINQRVQEETNSSNETPDNSYFFNEPIDSLSQLSNLQELQGKYLFIDLWASWCMPCRAEFRHKSKLEKLLDTYSNIVAVYISIDGVKQEKAWRNCINYYKLKGFHLRATSALQENIKKEIYKEKKVEIPRYILIGPEGKILNNDLPRPSRYPQLKEALEKIIK